MGTSSAVKSLHGSPRPDFLLRSQRSSAPVKATRSLLVASKELIQGKDSTDASISSGGLPSEGTMVTESSMDSSMAVQDDSGYKADDDKSVGDDDEVYLGQPAGGDESGIQAVLLLVPDELELNAYLFLYSIWFKASSTCTNTIIITSTTKCFRRRIQQELSAYLDRPLAFGRKY